MWLLVQLPVVIRSHRAAAPALPINAHWPSQRCDAAAGPEVFANHNAPPAVALSAVIYALRAMVDKDIPLNQVRCGCCHVRPSHAH